MILTLSIKEKFFKEIQTGKKKVETREIRANNADRYIEYIVGSKRCKANQVPPDATDVQVEPIKYDAIKFLTGEYKGTRPTLTVEVLGAKITVLTDEKGEDITYEFEGKEYVAAEIEYQLGKIMS